MQLILFLRDNSNNAGLIRLLITQQCITQLRVLKEVFFSAVLSWDSKKCEQCMTLGITVLQVLTGVNRLITVMWKVKDV